MRQVRGECIDDRNRLALVSQPDMNVHAEGLNPPGEPLHLLDEFCVTLNGCHPGITPVADGMRSGAGQ
jgi:hypothetical protein